MPSPRRNLEFRPCPQSDSPEMPENDRKKVNSTAQHREQRYKENET
jgi:hypothetical protein